MNSYNHKYNKIRNIVRYPIVQTTSSIKINKPKNKDHRIM